MVKTVPTARYSRKTRHALLCSLLILALLTALATTGKSQTFAIDSGVTLNNGVFSQGCSWIDLDTNGYLDLFVSTGAFVPATANPVFLNSTGVLSQTFSAPLGTDLTSTAGQTWGDYDNDGLTDLFVCNLGSTNTLYHNLGGGIFAKPGMGHLTSTTGSHYAAAWGDYDNDGLLDLAVCARDVTGPISGSVPLLYHHETGSLVRVASGPLVTTAHNYAYLAWIDYDVDGDLDLYLTCGAPAPTENNVLYKNLFIESGTASFAVDNSTVLTQDGSDALFPAWGDYDNDGLEDLYLTTWGGLTSPQPNLLYRATAPGVYQQIISPATGGLITTNSVSTGAAWGDYDNDGWLDLYTTEQTSANNRLWHNNGDGTFSDITASTIADVVSGYTSHGAGWGDVDRDGDLDLFVTYGYQSAGSRNRLYINSGNDNHWLTVICTGLDNNNRSGIGAKVRVKATVDGSPLWQMRAVSSTSGFFSTNLEQHFGLGSATVVDSLVIEWPSGLISVQTNLAVDQLLSVNDCSNANCESCCTGMVGNADGDPGDAVDISDMQVYIDFLFFGGPAAACFEEFDAAIDSSLDISDLQVVVDYLFFGGSLSLCL